MSESAGIARVDSLKSRALDALAAVSNAESLEGWRVAFVGRRGELTQLLRGLGSLPPEQRPEVGAAANALRRTLQAAADERAIAIHRASSDASDAPIDVTLPGWPIPRGGIHPTTRTVREICAAFSSMGFSVVEGPEIELERYNFEMLNIPKDHPARDMWDTLWIDMEDADEGNPSMLLRTHTSPMQARIMENTKPPIRVIVPGKCYRYEATDPSHEWHFYQIEGLAVDRGITMTDLKGTLYEFARRIFGVDRQVRFRCDYFPFVEPGVDVSIDCFLCGGEGCRVCGGTGWIEIMGAGMVHPKVLADVGLDPNIYTGFAFGMGPERIAMLQHGIDDIRLFYANDLRFLRQFG